MQQLEKSRLVRHGRKDYIMFGTTQGLLTVVDASSGKEKFRLSS